MPAAASTRREEIARIPQLIDGAWREAAESYEVIDPWRRVPVSRRKWPSRHSEMSRFQSQPGPSWTGRQAIPSGPQMAACSITRPPARTR